jgi:hypothetical protein
VKLLRSLAVYPGSREGVLEDTCAQKGNIREREGENLWQCEGLCKTNLSLKQMKIDSRLTQPRLLCSIHQQIPRRRPKIIRRIKAKQRDSKETQS